MLLAFPWLFSIKSSQKKYILASYHPVLSAPVDIRTPPIQKLLAHQRPTHIGGHESVPVNMGPVPIHQPKAEALFVFPSLHPNEKERLRGVCASPSKAGNKDDDPCAPGASTEQVEKLPFYRRQKRKNDKRNQGSYRALHLNVT